MTSLFGDYFVKQGKQAAIVEVSSGLAFVPAAFCPVYAASKAFVHSFTQSVRVHFSKTRVQVYEFAPPATKSNLGGSHDFGMETADFCQQVMAKFTQGYEECAVGMAE